MRIRDINIDRFGVWRGLALPLDERGVTVFYGPNEAGKSTLMHFVRGTLYGFNPQGRQISRQGLSTEGKGALRITHNGHEHTVSREADAGQRGRVRVDDLDWGTLSEDRVSAFLGGTSESMFENLFAIGLQELQELATLDGDEVAEHIYGLSLGPDGERILKAREEFQRERALLISDDHKSGEVVEWALRMAEVDRDLAELGDVSDKHQHLHGERRRLLAEIEQAERCRRNLEDNLRGYRFLGRVHGPWSRERTLREEQAKLPEAGPGLADELARYDTLTKEIDEQKRQHTALRRDARRLSQDAGERTGDPVLLQHECTIRRLADEREDIRHRERRLAENQSRADDVESQWDAGVAGLGGQPITDRLSAGPAQPAAGVGRLLTSARAYQHAQAIKRRTVNRYRKLVTGSQRRQAAFNERLKSLGGTSPSSAIEDVRQQLAEVDELNRLRLEEARLTGQRQMPDPAPGSVRRLGALINYRDLPPLFYLVMWFFTMAGATLFVLGLLGAATERVAAGNTAWIVGGIYACFGLCMAGVSWTVRQHFEQFVEGGLVGDATFSLTGKVEPTLQHDADHELSRVRQAIADLIRTSGLPELQQACADGGERLSSDMIRATSHRLADLELLGQQQERIQEGRKRLSGYRELLRRRQREVGLRRRQWCDVLRDLGLQETLKIDQAFEQWQALLEANEVRREHAALFERIDRDRQAIEAHRGHIDRLSGLLPAGKVGVSESAPDRDLLLTEWLEALRDSGGAAEAQTRLRREVRQKRKAASRLEAALRDLASERRLLLVQAGVSTREQLEQYTRSQSRRQELMRQIEDAQRELQLAAEEQPELAVVEEDLLAFHPGENKRRITDAEIQLKQIDRDVQTAREELGRVKRELAELANDRSAVSLRFEREQIAGQLRQVIERWCALDLAIDAVDRIRHRMERHGQSETLQLASQYLSQLTVGRYHNIWSPLGERHLCIDDDVDQTLRAEQLSTGTREQLFLAIRLAMIRRLAQEGIELPIVLDDVLVNFDQTRTEAAVETIINVAESGQQVLLFTCHLHLADIFESKGIDAVWLPSNQELPEKRRAG